MKIIFFGVRGSSVVTDGDFSGFGGDTTCLLVEGQGGERILIDAGTGAYQASRHVERNTATFSVVLLITHYHLDHLMGLPSMNLLYDRRWAVEMAAPVRGGLTIRDVVERLLDKPFWPLHLGALPSRVKFNDLPGRASERPLVRGGMEVRWAPLHHAEECTAYRIDEPATGHSMVFATDLEWAESDESERNAFMELCLKPAPAHTLIFDAQFTQSEYARHKGWGHSTLEEAAALSHRLEIKKLYLTHHAPANNDRSLGQMEKNLQNHFPDGKLARQGMEITAG